MPPVRQAACQVPDGPGKVFSEGRSRLDGVGAPAVNRTSSGTAAADTIVLSRSSSSAAAGVQYVDWQCHWLVVATRTSVHAPGQHAVTCHGTMPGTVAT